MAHMGQGRYTPPPSSYPCPLVLTVLLEVVHYLTEQRDMYKYIHDQTLRLLNHGMLPTFALLTFFRSNSKPNCRNFNSSINS